MKEEGETDDKLPDKKEEGTTDRIQNRKSKKERLSIADTKEKEDL